MQENLIELDLETGQPIVQRDDWADFTRRWAELRKLKGLPVHWAKLAVAMAGADGQRYPWDRYLNLAKFYLEFIDEKLQRQREEYAKLGWTIEPAELHWVVSSTNSRITASALAEALTDMKKIGKLHWIIAGANIRIAASTLVEALTYIKKVDIR